jgi:hypothetical protein
MAEQPNIIKTTLIPTQEEKDDYAIEFAEWKELYDYNGFLSTLELLEIFKKEKGL